MPYGMTVFPLPPGQASTDGKTAIREKLAVVFLLALATEVSVLQLVSADFDPLWLGHREEDDRKAITLTKLHLSWCQPHWGWQVFKLIWS